MKIGSVSLHSAFIVIFCLISKSVQQSTLLQTAISACGGVTNLGNGNCPARTVSTAGLDTSFKGMSNIASYGSSNVQLNFVGTNLPKNTDATSTNVNRYGLGAGNFQMQIKFTPTADLTSKYLVGRAVANLASLPNQKEEICNTFMTSACQFTKSNCPLTKNKKVTFSAIMPFNGNYYPGLKVDLRIEFYATASSTSSACPTEATKSNFGAPLVSFVIPGYIL